MLAVEMVVRNHLNIQKVQAYTEGTNLLQTITEEAVGADSVLFHWEEIADSIPHVYEKYSFELLKAVVALWVTVRTHAFAKGWTT